MILLLYNKLLHGGIIKTEVDYITIKSASFVNTNGIVINMIMLKVIQYTLFSVQTQKGTVINMNMFKSIHYPYLIKVTMAYQLLWLDVSNAYMGILKQLWGTIQQVLCKNSWSLEAVRFGWKIFP